MTVELSGFAKVGFWCVVLFLGVPTFGFLPLYIWWVARTQYPATLDPTGATLRSGKRVAWADIASVGPAPQRNSYWVDFKDGTRMTVGAAVLDQPQAVFQYLSQHTGRAFTL